MSLEQSIADLQTQAGLLLDLPQEIADQAQSRITQIGNFFDARVNTLMYTAYIDQVSGSDANDGNPDTPLKTIGEALSRTPLGGMCIARLKGDYHVDETLTVEQRYLRIWSDGSVRHKVTFERKSQLIVNTTYRILENFALINAQIEFVTLTLEMPAADGTWGNLPEYVAYNGFASIRSSAAWGANVINISYCDIDIPANKFTSLIGGGNCLMLNVAAVTMLDQALNGNLFYNLTSGSGTDSNTVPWLNTNLTTI